MNAKRTLFLFVIVCFYIPCLLGQSLEVLKLSRDSTVKIVSRSANSSGSGFLIADRLVMTCFHVVSVMSEPQPGSFQLNLDRDIQVILPSGESIGGEVITLPTQSDPDPVRFDFAIIKLARRPTVPVSIVKLALDDEKPEFGSNVVFSGFPLATPGMVTHKGMVSGTDEPQDLVFIEAPVNKGNSGGALLDGKGHVIGIVSMREGGISVQLDALRKYINATSASGSVQIMGVDPLQSTNAIINTLDEYISTGIGYARSIKFAREYLKRHPSILK